MTSTQNSETTPAWCIYRGTGHPLDDIGLADLLPSAPPWRTFDGGPLPEVEVVPEDDGETDRRLGRKHRSALHVDPHEIEMVNAAIYLRRPLLVTGRPGSGKSSLAYRISRELRLGRVLRWPITSNTDLRSGLYDYDAIGRAQAAATGPAGAAPGGTEEELPIGDFLRLGMLGTAFLPRRLPRVLLIDELDKSDSDLPHDLLSLFEDGEFAIPELTRAARRAPEVEVFTADQDQRARIDGGRVRCAAFPIIVITSNGEREFPPAFLRRCLQYRTKTPSADQLAAMVTAHALDPDNEHRSRLIEEFVERSRAKGAPPADKLLDALYLATSGAYQEDGESWPRLVDALWQHLNSPGA
ncbi:AAA family ATPase [Amycolatopsis sp. NPDC051758]|uniref:AAA family ATPase n=1 Tax=Amycolatopsis sp. NPDC051758 TaxID=3363935 RepID=UPI003796DA21